MKFTTLIFLLFCTFASRAQINFEHGYFINSNDEKIQVLIKNVDWKNNPTSFEYKLSEESEIKTGTIDQIKEFGVTNLSKFQRFKINIDRSSDNVKNLSLSREPEFSEELLFLKVLIEGKATLYSYEDSDIKRFFFKTDDSEIEQLIYKKYKIKSYKGEYSLYHSEIVAENPTFKQQLWNSLKCEEISINDIERVDYTERDLVSIFIEYNTCNNAEFVNHNKKPKTDFFNLTGLAGINYNSVNMENDKIKTSYNGKAVGFEVGMEAEFILPFNKNKWSLTIAPTFQQFKIEEKESAKGFSMNYKSFQMIFGVKHSFFLTDENKLYLMANLVFEKPLKSKITSASNGDIYTNKIYLETIDRNLFPNVGIGFSVKNKFRVQFRQSLNRAFLKPYIAWGNEVSTSSLQVGYILY